MRKQELEMCINEYGKDIYSFCKHLANHQQETDDLVHAMTQNGICVYEVDFDDIFVIRRIASME